MYLDITRQRRLEHINGIIFMDGAWNDPTLLRRGNKTELVDTVLSMNTEPLFEASVQWELNI